MSQNSFDILPWVRRYGRREFRGDLIAGLTVAVILIPQSMAYATLAGLEPVYGLYACLIPLLIYPLFGTAMHLAVGVVAIDMLIVAEGLRPLAEAGSDRYLALVVTLAALVGLIQIFMGAARLGFIVKLLSRPVIAGFTSAAAIIIAFSQLTDLSGIPLGQSQHIAVLIRSAAMNITQIHPLTLAFGIGGLAIVLALRWWRPTFPAALTAVVIGTLICWWAGLEQRGLHVVGDVPRGLPAPLAPPLSDGAIVLDLLPTAATLALVQFMSIMSLGKLFGAKHRYAISANRELLAIGAANLGGSFFKCLPISGSYSRTAVNEQAGARTPLANIVAALIVGLTLLLFTPLFYHLPAPILAAIIVVAALTMLDVKELRYLLKTKRMDGGICVLTFIATLGLGIQAGIIIGIVASVVAVMYRISAPNVAVLGHLPGTRSFRDIAHHPEARTIDGILLLRVDASFSFANADFLRDVILDRLPDEGDAVRAVIIDASTINDLDTTATAVLFSVADTLTERKIALYFAGVNDRVWEVIQRSGLAAKLGEGRFFLSPHRAVKQILGAWGRSAEYLESVPGETKA